MSELPIANVPGSSASTAAGTSPLDVAFNDEAGNRATRWTPFSYLATGAANQDSTNVKATAATLGVLFLGNTTSSIRFVKVYNKATAPTSSDTPALRFVVPGSAAGGGNNGPMYLGMSFASGLGFRITTGAGDSDTGTVSANDVIVNMGYV